MSTPDYVTKDRAVFLNQMINKEPYESNFLGYEITILPRVFLPSTASELIAEFIKIKGGNKIIDMGTGTGVLALIAGLQGGVGYATDFNPDAVRNARLNLDKWGIAGVKTIESDLFSNIPKDSYDLITFNRPFWDDYNNLRMKQTVEFGFSDPSGNLLPNFLEQSKNFIQSTGRIILSAAEWENLPQVEDIFNQFGFKYKILKRLSSKRDERRVYRAYELRL